MSAKTITVDRREIECHFANIKLLKEQSPVDAMEYALDAADHYERGGDMATSDLFLAAASAVECAQKTSVPEFPFGQTVCQSGAELIENSEPSNEITWAW